MLAAIGVVLSLLFVGWLAWRAAKKKLVKASMVMYGLACLAGVFTLAFFLTMDVAKVIKILACIILGGLLIYIAARLQQRDRLGQSR